MQQESRRLPFHHYKKKPVDFGPSPKVNVPKLPVTVTEKEKYKWHREERDYLNKLYEEMEKDRPSASVPELWDIFYRNMYERFKAFYSHRTRSEVEAKIKEMIAKRQFVSTKEKNYWVSVGATALRLLLLRCEMKRLSIAVVQVTPGTLIQRTRLM